MGTGSAVSLDLICYCVETYLLENMVITRALPELFDVLLPANYAKIANTNGPVLEKWKIITFEIGITSC